MSYNKEYIAELKNLLELYLHKNTFKLSIKVIDLFLNKYNFKSNLYLHDDYCMKGIYELRAFNNYHRSLIYISYDLKISIEYARTFSLGDSYEYIIIRDADGGYRLSIGDKIDFYSNNEIDEKILNFIKILDCVLNEEYEK